MSTLASQEPAQAVVHSGSQVGSGCWSHWAWQSLEQHWPHEERHWPWFSASAQAATQAFSGRSPNRQHTLGRFVTQASMQRIILDHRSESVPPRVA